ncbi:TetR/AcrR family transcriptional regulator [Streptomyces avicenniae]|uniref:TetR/AcrR family transcriptional regulator n=1 Tax=Streptomyces avicenniae TaxID=500153 RepID=UPI0006992B22|nr:TetR/AcrR family transcriptional regulator [Streptomyces avicenniae]
MEPDSPATTKDAATPARRPGGRSSRVREQVVAAVLADLVERGFDGMSIDTVAARSGVHRATVYRRWRDVGGLLAEALDATSADDWPPPDTGSLAGDLLALNDEVYAALTEAPPVARALIAASFRSGEAARALERLWDDRYARCEVIVARAVGRGEAAPDTDARRLLVAATAPLYHGLVLLRNPPDPDLPARAAEDAALAARAGAYRSKNA